VAVLYGPGGAPLWVGESARLMNCFNRWPAPGQRVPDLELPGGEGLEGWRGRLQGAVNDWGVTAAARPEPRRL